VVTGHAAILAQESVSITTDAWRQRVSLLFNTKHCMRTLWNSKPALCRYQSTIKRVPKGYQEMHSQFRTRNFHSRKSTSLHCMSAVFRQTGWGQLCCRRSCLSCRLIRWMRQSVRRQHRKHSVVWPIIPSCFSQTESAPVPDTKIQIRIVIPLVDFRPTPHVRRHWKVPYSRGKK